MLFFFIGTRAQFIKTYPVIMEAEKREKDYRVINFGQHSKTITELRQIFKIPSKQIIEPYPIHEDVSSLTEGLLWMKEIIKRFLIGNRHSGIFAGGGVAIIHGNTVTTLLSLLTSKRAGLKVAHIEAGLRSYNLFNPFPEEIFNIITAKFSDILFAPTMDDARNLLKMKVKGEIICTNGNTIRDTLEFILKNVECRPESQTSEFGLVTIHRFENIFKRKNLEKIIGAIYEVSIISPIIFILHDSTKARLITYNLYNSILRNKNIEILPVQRYDKFIELVRNSQFIMTDGGSMQEECAILGKPCLVMRSITERKDGLNENVFLWDLKIENLHNFMKAISVKKVSKYNDMISKKNSPSVEIMNVLSRYDK
jgi:UDP-N-acetylglucosamine 2-epimerase